MRTFFFALIGVVFFSAMFWDSPRPNLPAVSADIVSIGEVRRQRDTLIVERPADAREGAISSVFLLTDRDSVLRRVQVQYGRNSSASIEVVSGLSAGDRIVVSDMRAWDAFERVRMRN